MAYDAHKNLATSVVVTAPSPRDSGTSLVVKAGDGAIFPAASFNATATPPNQIPNANNSEIVRITNIATDTFTITRAQENTTAKPIDVGWIISATITAKTLTDIETFLYNPYKFRAIRNAAQNSGGAAFTKVLFDTKTFDTNTNFDVVTNNRYTAPVAGFYQLNGHVSTALAPALWVAAIYKNGSEYSRGVKGNANGQSFGSTVGDFIQLAATDFIELWVYSASIVALEVGAGAPQPYLSGFLQSQT